MSIPKFIHHSPTGSDIEAVKAYRQFSVQMFHEIAMRCRGVLETHHQMIVIHEHQDGAGDITSMLVGEVGLFVPGAMRKSNAKAYSDTQRDADPASSAVAALIW